MSRTIALVVAGAAAAACGGSGSSRPDAPAPTEAVDGNGGSPGSGGSGGQGGEIGPGGTGGFAGAGGFAELPWSDEVDPSAPRCEDLEAQGLLCHDGWCWELGGHQGNTLNATATDGTEVWAVGAAGTIVHWNGERWSREESGTLHELRDVDEAGGDVWAVGTRGTILRRVDGAWTAVAAPAAGDVYQLEVTAPGEAWIATDGGIARHDGGTWTWAHRGEDHYDLWSTGPDDVWLLGEKAARWDGAAFREVPTPFPGGRLGGSKPGRPFAASGNVIWEWTGSAFEERFAIPNDTFTIDFLAQRGGDLWIFASRGGLGSGLDDGRLLLRWDGSVQHEAWSESFLTHAEYARAMPLALALLEDGGAFLVGGRGRTLRWDGVSWSEPPRFPGSFLDILPIDTHDIWALRYQRSYSAGGLRWDGARWQPTELSGFSSTRLAGTGNDDVWATAYGLAHWDGTSWTWLQDIGYLADVHAISRDDVWAVGPEGRSIHWNGSRWSEEPTGAAGDLQTLWASGPDDVWAGGATLVHWNGSAWSVPPGIDPRDQLAIASIAGAGPDDVWAAGARLLHWGGARWSDVAPPPAAARCPRVWTAGPGATFTSCDNGFFRRTAHGWRRLPVAQAPSVARGPAALGYAVSGDALLRFCRE